MILLLVSTCLYLNENRAGSLPVNDVSLDNVSDLQPLCHLIPPSELQKFLETVACVYNIVCTGMDVTPISYRLTELCNVVNCDTLRVCENLGDTFRNGDL